MLYPLIDGARASMIALLLLPADGRGGGRAGAWHAKCIPALPTSDTTATRRHDMYWGGGIIGLILLILLILLLTGNL